MKNWKFAILFFWVILLIFPYLIGFLKSDTSVVFGGFLLNPIDGFSYIAKIQQGFHGSWFFQLPYTAEFNGKAILFIFYILLGHIAQIFSLNLIFVFHLFRVLFAVLLFFTLDRFVTLFFDPRKFFWKITFLTLIFGGGLGWLFLVSGNLPADFWVAEAFPFLSSFSNPHFPLTLTLMLWGYIFAASRKIHAKGWISIFLVGFFLSIISPFSALINGLIFLFYFSIDKVIDFQSKFFKLVIYFLGSAPMSIYQYIVVKGDPVLSLWNEQNITPTPTIGNFIFSFSPFLPGLCLFILLWIRSGKKKEINFQVYGLIFWIGIAIILIYLPVGLQRRFLVGLYIPIVVLFYIGLSLLIENYAKFIKYKKKLAAFFFILAFPSVFLVYSGSLLAIIEKNEKLFIPKSIFKSGEWIGENVEPGSVILSTSESGLILPTFSYIKTVCGHPFETIDYEETLDLVDDFWNGNMDKEEQKAFLKLTQADYVYFGVYEREYLPPLSIVDFSLVYESDRIKIFKVIQ